MSPAVDCESIGTGLLGQPVNTVTSAAFLVAGAAVALGRVDGLASSGRASSHPTSSGRAARVAYGACVASIGAGSLLFHGPQPAGFSLAHDGSILLTLGFMVGWRLDGLRRAQPRLVAAAAIAAVAALAAVPPATGPLALGALAAVLVGVETLGVSRRNWRALTVAGLGVLSWLAGHASSPLCQPDSPVQPHGLWHILAATALWLWWAGVDEGM